MPFTQEVAGIRETRPNILPRNVWVAFEKILGSTTMRLRQSMVVLLNNYGPASDPILAGSTGGRTETSSHPKRNRVAGPQMRPWHGPMPHRV